MLLRQDCFLCLYILRPGMTVSIFASVFSTLQAYSCKLYLDKGIQTQIHIFWSITSFVTRGKKHLSQVLPKQYFFPGLAIAVFLNSQISQAKKQLISGLTCTTRIMYHSSCNFKIKPINSAVIEIVILANKKCYKSLHSIHSTAISFLGMSL